jgi:hypothetical protein
VDQAEAVQVSILPFVIPAKAGIQLRWKFSIPAFAGMTETLFPMSPVDLTSSDDFEVPLQLPIRHGT